MSPRNPDIDRLVRAVESIPTLPAISGKIAELVSDENASFREIVDLIEKDQALATRILKVANSSFYGFLSKVSSLEKALVILGTREVYGIVLACSVHQFFSREGTEGFDRKRFWKHALVCSQIARLLGNHFNIRNDDTFFLAGLIHDIGKMVIDQYLHDSFVQIIDRVRTDHTTFSKAEKEILGTTHYQIGAKLLQSWQFPRKVVMEVLYHHAPWHDQTYGPSSIIIYLANLLAKWAGYPCDPDETGLTPQDFAGSRELEYVVKMGFDLDHESIRNMLNHIQESVLLEANNVMRLLED
jgi:putative nucleotidyltransferase with HDIG domain